MDNTQQKLSSGNHITIRSMRPSEKDIVFHLLKNMCVEEKMEHRFWLTPEKLLEEIAEKDPIWHCLVAEEKRESEILGILLYTCANTNREVNPTPLLHIDVLYVKPIWRRQKVGQELIEVVKSIAKQHDIQRIELWCTKDNESAKQFYQNLGISFLDHVSVYRMSV
ncbi:MAG: GNAT family N-acetyltransferase [Proteobacteria bacterium]|nr:GNAT family N-acetyltransferase [Pseudomonadota bacterium]